MKLRNLLRSLWARPWIFLVAPLRRSIAMRLNLGFSLPILFLATVGGIAWLQTRSMSEQLDNLVARDVRRYELAATMQLSIRELALAVAGMALPQEKEDLRDRIAVMTAARQQYDTALGELKRHVDGMGARARNLLVAVENSDNAGRSLIDATVSVASQREGVPDAALADTMTQNLDGPLRAWAKALDNLQASVKAEAAAAAMQSQAEARTVRLLIAAACVAGLVAGAVATVLISRSISIPLTNAVDFARAVADGDLSRQVKSDRQDEIGALLKQLADMQANLRRLVGDIRDASDLLQAASGEVATGNVDLSQRTELAAARLQQTAVSIDRLATGVRTNADSAKEASELASAASDQAQRGGVLVADLVRRMDEILGASRRIGEIIGVIDTIAFQTNILALNAAVEASRAGDQGRGFAVVAGEVRTLAQRSAEAAREIRSLVDFSTDRVNQGHVLVQAAGGAITELVASVRNVSSVVGEISQATTDQRDKLSQVHTVIDQLDQTTQQNAALVEETAAASESVKEQAQRLSELVNVFRLETTS